ncbi:unnamed protein product [Protopolystoma xenopodis]|uniref:Uncharacterized protein n=1 Tax=Protopolystoma xenopodis TaxID=117903 RepID=A0A3S5FDA7_9PLAT|nr:unnamed protein product [Protopolystoma xenopodis]
MRAKFQSFSSSSACLGVAAFGLYLTLFADRSDNVMTEFHFPWAFVKGLALREKRLSIKLSKHWILMRQDREIEEEGIALSSDMPLIRDRSGNLQGVVNQPIETASVVADSSFNVGDRGSDIRCDSNANLHCSSSPLSVDTCLRTFNIRSSFPYTISLPNSPVVNPSLGVRSHQQISPSDLNDSQQHLQQKRPIPKPAYPKIFIPLSPGDRRPPSSSLQQQAGQSNKSLVPGIFGEVTRRLCLSPQPAKRSLLFAVGVQPAVVSHAEKTVEIASTLATVTSSTPGLLAAPNAQTEASSLLSNKRSVAIGIPGILTVFPRWLSRKANHEIKSSIAVKETEADCKSNAVQSVCKRRTTLQSK